MYPIKAQYPEYINIGNSFKSTTTSTKKEREKERMKEGRKEARQMGKEDFPEKMGAKQSLEE